MGFWVCPENRFVFLVLFKNAIVLIVSKALLWTTFLSMTFWATIRSQRGSGVDGYKLLILHFLLFWGDVSTISCFYSHLLLGSPVPNEEGFVEFRMVGPLKYMWWYHVVGLIWISEFILACQQMTVAGAVVTYYFTRWGQLGCAVLRRPEWK